MKNKRILYALPFLVLTSLTTGCSKYSFKYTKIAVFADNQLTNNVTTGSVGFAIPFLRNHLKLCKEQNVDVIMIPGDLVNNAIEEYYQVFEDLLKEVYGTDESKYPEFVYSMGNHEWYTKTEDISSSAVTLFKKHARIETKALKKESESPVPSQNNKTAANYYKVINGIPFIAISSSNSSGMISSDSEEEIASWLKDINKLPSVKAGGPIFVASHYAIENVSYTHGQGALAYSYDINKLFENYPQAVIFTGDTHFSGVNERTINQVDYTNINLGSSSYTRHVSRSATMKSYDTYYNIDGTKNKDTLVGDVSENYNKTPTIHIVEVKNNGDTTYNRYFSTEEATSPKHLGLEWTIPAKVSKETFIYTNERFKNVEWAKKMYGADGLSWLDNSEVTYVKTSTGIKVSFPDVKDFNYCEHYKVIVKGTTTQEFDFVSHYYKWEDNSHEYNFEIKNDDLPGGDNFEIEVKAYDYFDNVSINSLKTNN